DGKWLILSRDRKGEENPGLYVQPEEGGPLVEVQHVAGVQTLFQKVSDDGKYLYFASNDRKKDGYTLYRWGLADRRREVVFEQDGLWSLADIRDNGRMLLRKATGSLTAEIFEWDPDKKALTPVIGQGETEEYDVAYGRGGAVLVLTPKGGDVRRLFRLEQGKLVGVSPERKFDVIGFDVDRARTRITYQTNEGGYTRPFAIDAGSYKELALPKLPASDHAIIVATTPDGRYSTVGLDDGKHPQQSFLIDWRGNKAEAWQTPSTPEIDTTRFARASVESYPARDGTAIPVLVRRPAACAAEPCPVVVHFHGGPEGQSRPGFNVSAQAFVDAGFVFVEPNVRGSDGYGKAWLAADDGVKRQAILTDIEDASTWARQHFAAGGKAPKLGIYGGSYGGYSSLIGMTLFAGAYDAGVDIVGISNLVTFLQNTAPYRRILRVSEYGDPERDRDALLKMSPITYVDRVKGPMLILQGATDPRVPAGEAVQIHEALTRRNVPSSLMIFPDEGHG
ncbi:MAG: S9 family peptidase, partial [Myxococcales bacterium]